MGFRLPPLNTLRLFEAAGRQLSFKVAAQELGVTPSGVSHGVQTLEEWLGAPLFRRGRRGISLTPAGEAYLPVVTEALRLLAGAADQIPGRAPGNILHVSMAPTFASRLVLPCLHRFRERYPQIVVSIDTSQKVADFPRDGADLGCRLGRGGWPGLYAEHLLTETLVPVCAPALLERLGPAPGLRDAPLIHVTLASQDWQAWADACGQGEIDSGKGLKVDTIQMAIEAAVQGLGIAIGRRPLVDPELSSGALVRFGDCEIASEASYWLVAPPAAMARPDVQAFRDWLRDDVAPFGRGGR